MAHVTSLPSFQVWKNGQRVEALEGAEPKKLKRLAKKYEDASASEHNNAPSKMDKKRRRMDDTDVDGGGATAMKAKSTAKSTEDGWASVDIAALEAEMHAEMSAQRPGKKGSAEGTYADESCGAAADEPANAPADERSAHETGRTTDKSSKEEVDAAVESGRRVFVANLPYSVTDETIRSTFALEGQITSIEWLTHRDTQKFKGSGRRSQPHAIASATRSHLRRERTCDANAPARPPSGRTHSSCADALASTSLSTARPLGRLPDVSHRGASFGGRRSQRRAPRRPTDA